MAPHVPASLDTLDHDDVAARGGGRRVLDRPASGLPDLLLGEGARPESRQRPLTVPVSAGKR